MSVSLTPSVSTDSTELLSNDFTSSISSTTPTSPRKSSHRISFSNELEIFELPTWDDDEIDTQEKL